MVILTFHMDEVCALSKDFILFLKITVFIINFFKLKHCLLNLKGTIVWSLRNLPENLEQGDLYISNG